MPVVQKQANGPQPRRTNLPGGSILSQAVDVASLPETHQKFLIYGANRVGKTTLACQWPKPLLLISFEPHKSGGATSVRKVPGVKYIRITSLEAVDRLTQELEGDTYYKTHVLDSATSLQDIVLQELLARDKPVEQINVGMVSDDNYRRRSEKVKVLLRGFLNLNAHTVVTAKEKDHKPLGEKTLEARMVRKIRQESFISCDVGGGTASWLQDACDYVTRLSVEKEVVTVETQIEVQGQIQTDREERETGEIIRRCLCQFHPNYYAGFRSDNPGAVPMFVEGKSPGSLYKKLQEVIRGAYKP